MGPFYDKIGSRKVLIIMHMLLETKINVFEFLNHINISYFDSDNNYVYCKVNTVHGHCMVILGNYNETTIRTLKAELSTDIQF